MTEILIFVEGESSSTLYFFFLLDSPIFLLECPLALKESLWAWLDTSQFFLGFLMKMAGPFLWMIIR